MLLFEGSIWVSVAGRAEAAHGARNRPAPSAKESPPACGTHSEHVGGDHPRARGARPDPGPWSASRGLRRACRAPARLGGGADRVAPLRRLASRHRQGRRAERYAAESRPAHARRAGRDPHAPECRRRARAAAARSAEALPYVLFHHERWDGKGYPSACAARDPGRGAAPRSRRRVRRDDVASAVPARAHAGTRARELCSCAGTQFDPELAELFVDVWSGQAAPSPSYD